MKRITLLYLLLIVAQLSFAGNKSGGDVNVQNLKAACLNKNMHVMADFVLDDLKLSANRMLVLTPVIEDKAGHIAVFRPLMLTGRSQHYVFLRQGSQNYPDAMEARRLNGTAQTVSYDEHVAYEQWMANQDATLRVSVDTCGCGNLLGKDAGQPVAINELKEEIDVLKAMKCPFVMPQAAETPEFFVEGAAYVTYELDSISLKPLKFNNPRELAKIYSDIEKVTRDSLLTITKVSIHGFASPEGRFDHNTYLARERAKTLLEWVKNECADKKVKVGEFASDFTPENWEGFIDSLNNHPELAHRDEILAIAKSDMEPDQRDAAIKKKYPQQYRYALKNWYPYLRHADYKVGFRLGQVGLEQVKELVKTRPQVLSLNQLFQAAQSYEVGSADFRQVFDVAVRMYPEDETVNVNAACAALMSGDKAGAARFLKKAGNTPQAINARGALALLEERYDDAEALFRQAKAAGLAEADANIELLNKVKNNK